MLDLFIHETGASKCSLDCMLYLRVVEASLIVVMAVKSLYFLRLSTNIAPLINIMF